MGRPQRVDVGGYVYHVLNRSVGQRRLFHKAQDFIAFERVLAEALQRTGGTVQLLAYCVMGNHWHLVLRTKADGVLSPFMKWLTLTHTQRYRVAHGNVGTGPVYQGRFKSFLVEADGYFLSVCRYVERNPVRAGMVQRAEDWPWSSLWRWRHPTQAAARDSDGPPLIVSPWRVSSKLSTASDGSGRPRQWLRTVNAPLSEAELSALQAATNRCQPYGSSRWVDRMVELHSLESTRRPQGRPRRDGDVA